MGGADSDAALSISLDPADNVYVTGYFTGTVDFDPGPDTTSLTTVGSGDAFVLKLDADGGFAWAQAIGGAKQDAGLGIASDAAGNVFVTGYFRETIDFSPGTGLNGLTSAGANDAFVLKLNTQGEFVWARNVGGTDSDVGRGIALDTAGNIYTAGTYRDTADLDPGVDSFELTSAGLGDIFLLKLDAGGNFVWAQGIGGDNGEVVEDVRLDVFGNVCATGRFANVVDFDPGPNVFQLTSEGYDDIFVLKLDADGDLVWARSIGGASLDWGMGIAADSFGGIYATGFFAGMVDFDPGDGVHVMSTASDGDADAFVVKLDARGNLAGAFAMGGDGYSEGDSIAVWNDSDVVTTGQFYDTSRFGHDALQLTSVGAGDGFVSKLAQSIVGDLVWRDVNGDGIQNAGEPGIPGVLVELFQSNDDVIGNNDDRSLGTRVTDGAGKYQYAFLDGGKQYYLEFHLPVNHKFTFDDVGGNDALDSDVDPAKRHTSLFTLDVAEMNNSLDAGLLNLALDRGAAVIVESDASTRVTEGGNHDTYTLALSRQPSREVIVEVKIDEEVRPATEGWYRNSDILPEQLESATDGDG